MVMTANTPIKASGETSCNEEQDTPVILTHPQYDCKHPDYVLIEDCLEGQRRIKEKGTAYLPKTSAQKKQDTSGNAYEAYKDRAIYYNFPKDTVEAASGMLQREPSDFILPAAMESLQRSATIDNEPLSEVLADINENQVSFARYGLLVDIPEADAAIPYLVKYGSRAIVNWYEDTYKGKKRLRMVTLDESGYEIGAGGQHEYTNKYRICAIDSQGKYWTTVLTQDNYAKIDFENFDPPEVTIPEDPYPNYKSKQLDYIPFVFINVSDLCARPQVSPILDICDISIAIYRKEADHAQAEFMQGQSTPYATGITEDEMENITSLGSTTMLSSQNDAAKFGFMEISGDGLSEMAATIKSLKDTVVSKSYSIMDKSGTESGQALSIRSSSSTSILKAIAITGAEGLRMALSMIDNWMQSGLAKDLGSTSEDDLNVIPNLDFIDDDNSRVADDLLKLVQAKNMGYPISKKTLHEYANKKEVTSLTYESELDQIAEEGPAIPMIGDDA